MIKRIRLLLLVASLAGLAAAPAMVSGAVDVRSGAVGHEHRQEMMAVYQDYNLHLVFAEQGGAFIAGVDVTISDAQGRPVWSGSTQGPYLFAQLPRGRYLVQASYEGRTRQRGFVVGRDAGPMHYLYW